MRLLSQSKTPGLLKNLMHYLHCEQQRLLLFICTAFHVLARQTNKKGKGSNHRIRAQIELREHARDYRGVEFTRTTETAAYKHHKQNNKLGAS